MRKGLALTWLLFLLAGIAVLFWRSEWIYNLPTPVPPHYQPVNLGSSITLPAMATQTLAIPLAGNRPLFLHFFNPDCPCSRFNMPQFRSLVQQYGRQVDFAIVLMTDKKFTAAQIRDKFDLPYPVPVMADSAIAAACGVYSTPQAVILDAAGKRLYYRGNYNRNRYCSDEKSSYARIALDELLHHNYTPTFSPLALKAYGCQLPTCRQ